MNVVTYKIYFPDVGKVGSQALDKVTDSAYNAMTSNGDINLTYHIYKLSFLNFLLGKQPNGPGQYMFGLVNVTSDIIFSVEALTLEERRNSIFV